MLCCNTNNTFNLIKRCLLHTGDLKDYPFYLLLADWADSFMKYPPCSITKPNKNELCITFEAYIPSSFSLSMSIQTTSKILVSKERTYEQVLNINPTDSFTPPDKTIYIKFAEDFDVTKLCLGLQIEHLHNGIFIHQSNYIQKILKRFNMDKAHPLSTPMVVRSLDVKKDPYRPPRK